MNKNFTFFILAVITLLYTAQNISAVEYHFVELGTLGGTESDARDINNSGRVVGSSYTVDAKFSHAFLYQSGIMTDLGVLPGGNSSYANGINDAGQIVGSSNTQNNTAAFIYESGTMQNLTASMPDIVHSFANQINNTGQIVGYVYSTTDWYAYIHESGILTDLGGNAFNAYGINDFGQVVGVTTNTASQTRGFVYDSGTITELGTLGGNTSNAHGINNAGQIVGDAETSSGDFHAYLCVMGMLSDLGTLGGAYSSANDINESGQIVGLSEVAPSDYHAFLYENGIMKDLNDFIDPSLDFTALFAYSINDRGDIVGQGINSDGFRRGFVLYAVPEPATIILSLIGAVSLFIKRRMK
ncbi:MAG: PEP-CTERM sorting domain-containing protein [Candidatus Auribacter fodinae]|jgi:probable HAF family extracellular repeat protein|uniref:PEP-CTERM sorting domain-containing protein n=1 Tax=Candidatus Auribacter fodinae TaxID=2093366 RepID=A0A3A4R8Q5_9BACT|nr:MAG: PEP-CTERM sorting domain-containing protein [Candidatus Auribacter fodinae]